MGATREKVSDTPAGEEIASSSSRLKFLSFKALRIGPYGRYAAMIIAFATGLRVLLDALGWPPTNADETTMGIMALNIANRGEHPYFFYGQDYMGSLEAYLAAIFFHLFGGPSLFALRLGVILLVTLFFVTTYLLASLLFSKKLALVTLLLLSVGSIPYLTRQMIATGGSSQTLLFGSIAFLLAAWLGLTYRRGAALRIKLWRLLGCACWALVIGLGLWSDMVVLPYFLMAGLLLLLFCWRDLLWAWVAMLPAFIVGLAPLLKYDSDKGLSSWNVLLGLVHGSSSVAPHTLSGITHNILATVQVSIPTATGYPFCPVLELPFLGDTSPHVLQCTIAHGVWGWGYLPLLAVALMLALSAVWRVFRSRENAGDEKRREWVRHVAQLLMLGAAALNILVYIMSSGPVDWPGFHARYLIGLLIVTPAVIAPLWSAASKLKPAPQLFERVKVYGSRAVLIVVWCILFTGTIIAFSEVPAAQAASQQRADLINHLLSVGATHIYTDYWSCNNLAFQSNERIICGVVDNNLQPSHNRAPRYYDIVHADPHSAYVFPVGIGQLPAVYRKVQQAGPEAYRRYEFDGYIVYVPVGK